MVETDTNRVSTENAPILRHEKSLDTSATSNSDNDGGPLNIWMHEKEFRQFIEKKMYQENFGKVIEIIIGCIAFATSVINVILSYLETNESGTYSKIFNKFDYAACCLFLISYCLKCYVATHRLQYIFSLMSILDLFILLPTMILVEPSSHVQFSVLILFSRYVRSISFFLILQRYFKLGQSDVDR